MSFSARGLPTLSGRWLLAYRLLWAAMLLAAIAAGLVAQIEAVAPTKLLHAIVLIAVAAMLRRRRPTDPLAAMLSFAFLLWAATTYASASAMMGGGIVVATLDRLRFLLFVTAMMLFPSGRFDPAWTRYAIAATLLVAMLGMLAAAGIVATACYVAPAMGCAALAVAAMRRRFRGLPPGIQRQQIKWVALGLTAGLAFVAASRLPLPFLSAALDSLLFDFGVTLMALGVLVSLLRYRLYDADAAISRSTAYAALTLALVAMFAASEALLQALSLSWFGASSEAYSGGIAAALAAALTAPLHQQLTRWTEQRFQKALTALRMELPALVREMSETASLQELGDAVLQHIDRALRPVRSAMVVGGDVVAARRVETADRGDLGEEHFPLSIDLATRTGAALGSIRLGPRPDGSRHGRDEREALADVAGAIAAAVGTAQRRRQRFAAEARRRNRLVAVIKKLEARIALLETGLAARLPA